MSWIELPELRTQKSKVFADSENPSRKRVESSIDDIHYHDGSQWLEVNEDLATDTTDGYAASSSRMRHIFRVGNTGTRRWIPRREFPNEYVSFGRLMSWTGTAWQNVNLGTPTRVGKQISWSNVAFDLSLSVNWHKIKLLAILKTEAARRRLRWQVSLNGLTYNQGTLISVSDSSIVGYVEKPIAWDANGSEDNQNVAITTTYSGGYLEFGGNLAGAVLPITIDPTLTLDEGDGGSKDAHLSADDPTLNYGTSTSMSPSQVVSPFTTSRSLIEFDLSNLPDEAVISSATLSLYLQSKSLSSTKAIGLYRLKRSWVEGINDGVGGNGGVNWNKYDGTNNWTSAGAFNVNDCEQTAIATRDFITTETTGVFKDFSLSGSSKADISLGYGWLIKQVTETTFTFHQVNFASSDTTTAANRPKLVIVYEESAGGTDACTALDITSGTPTVEATAIGQKHSLVGTDVVSGVPTIEVPTTTADWYNSSWGYRVKITVDADEVGATLTNFPVYVNLANLPAGFHTNVNQTDARDIRVTKADGTTEISREVVFYTAASDIGELHFKGDLSATVDTDFYIYYGNAGATEPAFDSEFGRDNVWTGYEAVYHLQQDPSGGAPQIVDSTGNGRSGSSVGSMTSGDLIDAPLGKGLDFDGSNDGIAVSAFTPPDAITFSFWANVAAGPAVLGGLAMFAAADANSSLGPTLYNQGGTTLKLRYANRNSASAYRQWYCDPPSTGSFVHIAAGQAGINNTPVIYINTVSKAVTLEANAGTPVRQSAIFAIGKYGGYNGYFANTDMDEVRVANTLLSAEWVAAEYSNQSVPTTFYFVGDIETPIVGSSSDELIALDILSGTLVVEQSTVGQKHTLTSTDIVSSTPTPELATLGQKHVLTSVDVLSGTPTVEQGTLSQIYALTSLDVLSSAPVIEASTIGQKHNLTGVDIIGDTPVIEQATIGQVNVLASFDVVSGTSIVEASTLGQKHALTSSDVVSGTPAIQEAAVSQVHGITSVDIVSGQPTVEQSTIGQVNNLASVDVILGTPVIEASTLTQKHALTSVDILSSSPTIEIPTVSQTQVLTSVDILSGTPVIEIPTIGQKNVLTSQDILLGTPAIEQSTIGQIHSFAGLDILSGTPTIDSSTIGQIYDLTSLDVVSGIPIIETPSTVQEHGLVSINVVLGTPVIESSSIGQQHVLVSTDIQAGTPNVEQSTIGQTHVLSSLDIVAGTPIIETPIAGIPEVGVDELTALDVVLGTPTIEQSALGQIHIFTSLDILSGIPTIETPSIGQIHGLVLTDLVSGTPIIETPTLGQVYGLISQDIQSGNPTVGSPSVGQKHSLVSADIQSGTASVEQSTIGQVHGLTLADVLFGTPALEQATIGQVHALLSQNLIGGISEIEQAILDYELNPVDLGSLSYREGVGFELSDRNQSLSLPSRVGVGLSLGERNKSFVLGVRKGLLNG